MYTLYVLRITHDPQNTHVNKLTLPSPEPPAPLTPTPPSDTRAYMSDLSDPIDPVAGRHIAVPPQLVEAVQTDPEVLAQLSRAQLILVQDKLTRQYLRSGDASIAQGTAVAEILRKTANLEPKQTTSQGGNGFSITINIPQVGDVKGTTIEARATALNDLDTQEAPE